MQVIKKLFAVLLATMMVMGTSVTAFAANEEMGSEEIQAEEVSPRAVGTVAIGDIAKKGNLTLRPELYSYVGLQRTLYITTTSLRENYVGERVYFTVYKPNGGELARGNLMANGEWSQTFTLPSSGTYRIELYSNINEKVHVVATWSTN